MKKKFMRKPPAPSTTPPRPECTECRWPLRKDEKSCPNCGTRTGVPDA